MNRGIKMLFGKSLIQLFVILAMCYNTSEAQEITADTRYDHAKVLYNKGLYLAARSEFTQIKNDRYKADVSYYTASSAVKAGQDDGEYLIKRFVKNYPSHLFAKQAFFELGNYYYEKGDFENALKYFKQSQATDQQELSFKSGYSYFQLKQYDEALEALSMLKGANNSYEFDAAYFQGYIFYDKKNLKKAYEHLSVAFKSDFYKEDALVIYVSALYQLQKYKELIDLVSNEMPDTNNPMINNYVADSHYALKSYRNAKDVYQPLLKNNSKYRNETNYFKAGFSAYKIDHLDDAIDYLKRAAVADDTVGAYASYYLGLIYHSKSNLPFAVTSFQNTAKYDTRLKQDALYHQGSSLLEVPNYQEAIDVLTAYSTTFPKGRYTQEVNEMLSIAYSHTNDYDLAMSYIESLPTLTEPVKRVYQRVTFIKAMSLFNDKNFNDASEIFQKSLIYNSDPAITQQSYFWMGETLSLLQKEKEALFYYKSVRNADVVLYQKSTYGLGYAYFNLKNYDDALVTFSKIENASSGQLDKRYAKDAVMRMADCHFALKNYEKGIVYYKKALASESKNAGQIYFQIGLLNRYLDKDEEAKTYFNHVINDVPNSTKKDQAQFQIAEIDYKTGNEQAAIRSYGTLLSQYPNSPFVPYALLNQAVAYDNLQNSTASIKNYEDIVDRFPRHETAKGALLALQGKSANGIFTEFDAFLAKYKAANPNSDALENIEFENARVLFFNQKYDDAILQFSSFIKTYPSSTLVTESKYFIGDAYYRNKAFEKSLASFYHIEKVSDFSKHDRVLFRIAEMESELGNLKKGNEYYYKLGVGVTSARNQIFLEQGLMKNYLALSEYDSTIKYGNALLDNPKIGVVVEATANLALGKALYFKKAYDQSLIHFLSLVNNAPDENGAEANYYVGKIFFDRGAYDKSLESLFSLTNNFKNYELWQGKAFLLMADVYLKTDEIFQAKATLNSLIDNSEIENVKKEAKSKLEVIESMNVNEGANAQ